MPTYKLLYFNLRGIGELVRLLFKQAGVDFEDFRFSRDGDWHKYIDGKTVWFVNFSDSVQCILFSNYVRMNVWIHIRWSNRDCYLLLWGWHPPPPLRTAYRSILALRTAYCHFLASRTAYHLTTKNSHFGRFHLHKEVKITVCFMHMYSNTWKH